MELYPVGKIEQHNMAERQKENVQKMDEVRSAYGYHKQELERGGVTRGRGGRGGFHDKRPFNDQVNMGRGGKRTYEQK